MKYYLHDTSAFDDEKVSELFIMFGYEGVGLFYVLLEKLGKQEKPIKTHVLKKQLSIGKRLEKCWSFMEEIGLISSNNGETFNKQLLNYSEKYQIKKEKTRIKVSEWRDKQVDTDNVTSYNDECNQPKVKESKVKENKKNNSVIEANATCFSFEDFWKIYPVKNGKAEAEKKYAKLSEEDRLAIKNTMQSFLDNPLFKGYNYPMATTFINQKRWHDFEQKTETKSDQKKPVNGMVDTSRFFDKLCK